MFNNHNMYNIGENFADSDSIISSLKRVQFIDNNTFLLLTNSDSDYIFTKMNINGKVLSQYKINLFDEILVSYIYIDNAVYAAFYIQYEEFEEQITIYKITENNFVCVASFPRMSYLHDLDYFYMFNKDNKLRLLIIRHTRLYLYGIQSGNIEENNPLIFDDYNDLVELSYLDGYKWYINNGIAININNNTWEMYNTDLKQINSFEFSDSNIDWLGITKSKDNSLIAVAADCANDNMGLLCIYNYNTNTISTHIQNYGFYSAGIIKDKIITSIISTFSGIGGIMVFNNKAQLKYAHIKDEEDDKFFALSNNPVFYQAMSIKELCNGYALISVEENTYAFDFINNYTYSISNEPYECLELNSNRNIMIELVFENRKNNFESDRKYNTFINVYDFSKKDNNKADIVNIKSYRKM